MREECRCRSPPLRTYELCGVYYPVVSPRFAASTTVFLLVAVACAGGLKDVDAGDAIEIDFIGELAEIEADTWAWDGPTSSGGGPDSELLGGPGVLRLDDGEVVTIDASTPGGNACAPLGADIPGGRGCLIIGAYRPGTTTAAWFHASQISGAGETGEIQVGQPIGVDGRTAVFDLVGTDSRYRLEISREATFTGRCLGMGDLSTDPIEVPDDYLYFAAVDHTDEISMIECVSIHGA